MAPRQYCVRNWTKFQHYKNRNPPWIKLHIEILASEDWVSLDDASKLLAIVCMMIASKNDGHVPDSPEYIQRVAYLDKKPNLKPLVDCGFLEIPLAGASDNVVVLADARPEKETEQSRVEHKEEDRFKEFWEAYPKKTDWDSAKKVWDTLKVDPAIIISGARAYAQQQTEQDVQMQFIKKPETWLSKKGWLDHANGGLEILTPDQIAANIDKADKIFRRGKYADLPS